MQCINKIKLVNIFFPLSLSLTHNYVKLASYCLNIDPPKQKICLYLNIFKFNTISGIEPIAFVARFSLFFTVATARVQEIVDNNKLLTEYLGRGVRVTQVLPAVFFLVQYVHGLVDAHHGRLVANRRLHHRARVLSTRQGKILIAFSTCK